MGNENVNFFFSHACSTLCAVEGHKCVAGDASGKWYGQRGACELQKCRHFERNLLCPMHRKNAQ